MAGNTSQTLAGARADSGSVALDDGFMNAHCDGFDHEVCTCDGDGRVKRRIRNRQAMIVALGELIQSGVAEPSLDDVAAHAGVSSRSVYRHFGSMDEARGEWADEVAGFVAGYVDDASGPVMSDASLRERCRSLVSARFRLHDAIGSVVRTANARRFFSERASEEYEKVRAQLDAQVRERFAAELSAMSSADGAVRLAVANAIVSIETIDDLMVRNGEHRSELLEQLGEQLVTTFSR